MTKRSKNPRDMNQMGRAIVDKATSDERPEDGKDPAAVELGRRGGQGGKARAAKLSPEDRSRIARKAARARWGEPD